VRVAVCVAARIAVCTAVCVAVFAVRVAATAPANSAIIVRKQRHTHSSVCCSVWCSECCSAYCSVCCSVCCSACGSSCTCAFCRRTITEVAISASCARLPPQPPPHKYTHNSRIRKLTLQPTTHKFIDYISTKMNLLYIHTWIQTLWVFLCICS